MNAPQQGFKERADAELKNAVLKIAIDRTTGNAERKRAVAVAAFPEFQAARARGRAIKDHVIAHLDHYLEMFERNATAAGDRDGIALFKLSRSAPALTNTKFSIMTGRMRSDRRGCGS